MEENLYKCVRYRLQQTNITSICLYLVICIQVDVFWVVTPCIAVVGHQRFGAPCYLHLQGVTTQKTST